MKNGEAQTEDLSGSADDTLIRWRPWPCEGCRGSTTPIGFLDSGSGSNPEVQENDRNGQIDQQKKNQGAKLVEWVKSCPHTRWSDLCLPRLDQGSEHLVLFDGETSEVVKLTLPGTYGDYYEIIDDRIYQFDSTPEEYLLRMRWWEKLFSTAPAPMGVTESGQIVSRQKFILGDPDPPQETVDQFLIEAGAVAVRQSCWLWRKVETDSRFEVWIGDARSDNFVLAADGIVPIDIRIWSVPLQPAADK